MKKEKGLKNKQAEKPEGYVFGRPTLYKQEYCEMLKEHMGKGFSFESFAGLIGTDRSTIYEWLTSQKDFSDAKKQAFELSRLFWEQQGLIGLYDENFGNGAGSRKLNATVYIFNMKNRFPDEWREKTEVKHDGEIKSGFQINFIQAKDDKND